MVLEGPDLERNKVVRWRCADLRVEIASRWSVSVAERTVGKLLRRRNVPTSECKAKECKSFHRRSCSFQNGLTALVPPQSSAACISARAVRFADSISFNVKLSSRIVGLPSGPLSMW